MYADVNGILTNNTSHLGVDFGHFAYGMIRYVPDALNIIMPM